MFIIDDIFNNLITQDREDNRAHNTNVLNERLQDKALAYNEKMQNEQWRRDDTAYQRMVNDMTKAGLNPLAGGSPTSSPLSFQSQASNAVSPQTIPLDLSLNGLLDALQFQEGINLQNKRLNLDAIRSGVSPDSLGGNDSSVIKLFNDIQKANLKILNKEANSPYSRSEGSVEKTYKGIKSITKDIFDNVDSFVESKTGNHLSDIPKVVKKVKVVDAGQSSDYAKDMETYYKNKAFKIRSTNNPIRIFRQWLRAKNIVK